MTDRPAAARALVLAHGWNAMSYQVLNPGFTHWFDDAGDALVGYVRHGRVRVAAGAPICPADRVATVAAAFERDARSHGERNLWVGAGTRLERVLASDRSHATLPLGAQPWWDPRRWHVDGADRASLRAQLHRARNKGVEVESWPPPIAAQRRPALQRILDGWLATRGLPPLHFLIEPQTLDRLDDRRVFVAVRGTTPIAFMLATPIPARRGWLIEQWPRLPQAPNGTVELLLDTVMRALGTDGAEQVTLGLAPLSTRAPCAAAPAAPLPAWVRLARRWAHAHGRRFYDFDGLDAFKAKFVPDHWEPLVAIVDRPRVDAGALWAIAGAFGRANPALLALRGLTRALRTELRRTVR